MARGNQSVWHHCTSACGSAPFPRSSDSHFDARFSRSSSTPPSRICRSEAPWVKPRKLCETIALSSSKKSVALLLFRTTWLLTERIPSDCVGKVGAIRRIARLERTGRGLGGALHRTEDRQVEPESSVSTRDT